MKENLRSECTNTRESYNSESFWNKSRDFTDPTKLELPGPDFVPLLIVFVNNNFTMSQGDFHVNSQR